MDPHDHHTSLSDLLAILRRRKWPILLFGAIGFVLVMLWAVTRPIIFQAESSFQEKGVQGAGGSGMSGFLGLLSGSINARPDTTIPLMKSKRLLAPLVQQHGLQVAIIEEKPRWPLLERVQRNLVTEWAYLRGLRGPLFQDKPSPLLARDVLYTAEEPMELTLHFKDNVTFDIWRTDTPQNIAEGHLDTPIAGQDYLLILTAVRGDQPLSDRRFTIAFETLDMATKGLRERLVIKTDEKSDKILKLMLSDADRHTASQLLNSLMDEYQHHLKGEHKNLADAQLEYLESRRQDSAQNLHNLIANYAMTLSEELMASGMMESEKELERLEQEKAECRRRVMEIDLELYRLQSRSGEESGYLTTIGAATELPELVQETISNLNELKQRRDRLALALRRNIAEDDDSLHKQLKEQMTNISTLQAEMDLAAKLQALLEANHSLPPPDTLSNHVPPLLRIWYGKLYDLNQQRQCRPSQIAENEWSEQKHHFLTYLTNFQYLSAMHQRLMRERLALQQNPGPELQGVDLITSGNIYVALTTQKNDVQAEIRQNSFVIDQVQDPSFEVSALSGIIRDPVGQGIVQHYSSQSMSLKDSNIRTSKELDRIREELDRDRSFLLFHLQQGTELLRLREDFLEKKILAIQEVMLDLIQQQVSICEKHLEDFRQGLIEQLKQEKSYLTNLVREINQQMANLPQKWVAEQVIKHQATVNRAIVEEVSKLVETKNISHHLEMVQSGPLDHATPPVLPKRPLILFFAFIGFVLGAGITTLWVVSKELFKK